jgi:hypothetical protein
MPIRKLWLNKIETREHNARLSQLEAMGIPVRSTVESPPDPDRLTLEAIYDGTGKIYDLPSHAVLIVIPARLLVLKSGLLVTDVSLKIPWEDCPVELNELGQELTFETLMRDTLPDPLPTILNRWLKSEVPLRPRRVAGVILAEGWTSFSAEYQHDMPVAVQLSISDERHQQLTFDFEVRVDRSVKRRYEQRQKKYYQSMGLTQPPAQIIPPQPPQGSEEKSSDNRSESGGKLGSLEALRGDVQAETMDKLRKMLASLNDMQDPEELRSPLGGCTH